MGGNRNGKNFVYKKDGRKDFYYHDDRTSSDNNNKDFNGEKQFYSGRREQYQEFNDDRQFSSGKRDQYQKRGNFRGEKFTRGRGAKKFLNNEDVFMSEGKSRFQHMYDRKGRGGFRMRGRSRGGRTFIRNNSDWNKIILKDAGAYPKEEVLNKLHELVEEDFVPIMMEAEFGDMVFYLEKNDGVARAIKELSGRLILGKKQRITIFSSEKPPPDRKLSEPHIDIIKKVMGTRFSLEMNRLDLKRFHNDKALIKEQIFCPLYRRQCLQAVIEIIIENCSNVEEIDLSWNGIFNAQILTSLKKCANLKRLYLEKNQFRVLSVFDSLKGLGITDLSLEGNPLCDSYKDAESYVNAVRELFPRVERLDGMDLPKPITFEVEENVALPVTKPSYFCSEEVRAVVLQFVQQYYQVFESSNRSTLQAAYTEDAQFSLSAYIPDNAISGRIGKWVEFDNRNMKKVLDSEKRQKLLYKGRENIIKVLSKMPPLTHDPNSFVIDIPFAKPCLMHVVVTGIFKQIGEKNVAIRNFMKSLIIVPVGSGFCIANEELLVNIATIEQIRKAFKEPVSVSEQPTGGASTSSDPMASLDPAKLELVKSFSVNTKMLPQYCIMCLENNNWDFQKAGEMFLGLQVENKIPPEYFGTVV